MTGKDRKQSFAEASTDAAGSGTSSGIRPGHINFGSHLDPYERLSARLRAEIDRRLREIPSK